MLTNKKKYYQCRLCLAKSESEFSYSLLKANLPHMIESLTSIKITRNDKFPTSCCETCLAHVHLAYRLQQRILKSDKTLRETSNCEDNGDVKKQEEENNVIYIESINDENVADESITEDSLMDLLQVKNEVSDATVKIEFEEASESEAADMKSTKDENYTDNQNENKGSDLENSIFEIINISEPEENLVTFNDVIKKRLEEKRKRQVHECTECNIKFESRPLLSLHLKKHDVRVCSICHASIRTDNFKRHFEMHSADKEICEICGKVAKNKESLRGHMFYQHRPDIERYKCEECNREFRYRYKYTMHIKKAHTGERNYQCEVCGKKFFTAFDTKKHVEMTHFKARPYICKYCKRGYSSRYALKTHIRQHTLETPFRCELCAAGFRQRVSLRTHLKSKHNITDRNMLYGKTKITDNIQSEMNDDIKNEDNIDKIEMEENEDCDDLLENEIVDESMEDYHVVECNAEIKECTNMLNN